MIKFSKNEKRFLFLALILIGIIRGSKKARLSNKTIQICCEFEFTASVWEFKTRVCIPQDLCSVKLKANIRILYCNKTRCNKQKRLELKIPIIIDGRKTIEISTNASDCAQDKETIEQLFFSGWKIQSQLPKIHFVPTAEYCPRVKPYFKLQNEFEPNAYDKQTQTYITKFKVIFDSPSFVEGAYFIHEKILEISIRPKRDIFLSKEMVYQCTSPDPNNGGQTIPASELDYFLIIGARYVPTDLIKTCYRSDNQFFIYSYKELESEIESLNK